MTTTTDRIVETAARSLMNGHIAEAWQFIRDQHGLYHAESWFDENKLTAAERAEIEVFGPDPFDASDEELPNPRFRSLELAKRWAALVDQGHNISAALDIYNAPSECAPLAYRKWNLELELVLAQEV